MFDLRIINGDVIDGSGTLRKKVDIGIIDDKINAIRDLKGAKSRKTIDAKGKIVAPGFIDMHTHSDLSYIYDQRAEVKLFNGVTTECTGNCGIGVAPVKEEKKQLLIDYLGTRLIGSIPVNIELPWNSFKEYIEYFNNKPPIINMAPLLGQGVVRIAVKGFNKGMPTYDEIREMKYITDAAMEEGALGLSSGLVYLPGEYSSAEEIAKLCTVVASHNGFYATHMRTESDGILDAIDEALWIGKNGNVPVHISHLKLLSQKMLGKTDLILEKITKAEKKGIEVTYDLYPYIAGLTSLSACLPPWVFEGGISKLIERLFDNNIRVQLKHEILKGLPNWQNFVKSAGGWEKFFVSAVKSEKNKNLEGKYITEIANLKNKDPFDVVFDLLIEENGRVQMNYFAMDEQDIITFIKQPQAMIGSDSMALSTNGVLSFGKPHPRAFGTPARFLGRYVRDMKILTFEEAIRKMTSMPAKRLGLQKRGILAEGYFADIVVFNPKEIKDQATYEEPQQYSTGVDFVVVNGQVVLEDGKINECLAGKIVGH